MVNPTSSNHNHYQNVNKVATSIYFLEVQANDDENADVLFVDHNAIVAQMEIKDKVVQASIVTDEAKLDIVVFI